MKDLLKMCAMMVLLLFCATNYGYSQGKGILTGKVVDEGNEVLPGASIVLKGTTQGTTTNLDGLYNLHGINAGSYQVEVSYLGYVPVVKKVVIVANKTTVVDFKMNQSNTTLNEVVVSAVMDGQQRALNQQKVADNVMQVVSADQMGRFPDLNVAESLQRLSGVTITRSRGEGAEIQLRGTPANFVNLQMNGEQLMGTNDGSRNATLDVISSDVLASMEVQKTLLPSNDGDAIAGIINMRTATARTLKNRFSIDVSSGYNILREKLPYNIKAGWQKRFSPSAKNPQGRFGIAANASYYRTYNGYDRLEAQTWDKKTLYGTDGKKIPDSEGYVPLDFRYRYQEGSRARTGATLTFDYAPTLNTSIILSGMYTNRYEDDTRYRSRARYRGKFYDMGNGAIGNDRVTSILQVTDQDIKVDIYNLNLDAKTIVGNWKLDGGVFYSQTKKDAKNAMYGFQTPDWRANNKNITGTDNGKGKPIKIPEGNVIAQIPSISSNYLRSEGVYQMPDGLAYDDASRYSFYELVNNDDILKGRNATVRANASLDYQLFDKFSSAFSFGAKGKFMYNERYKPESATVYTANSNEAKLNDFLYTERLSDKFLGNNLTFGLAPSLDKIKNYVDNNPDAMTLNDYRTGFSMASGYYEVKENVLAGYVMNRTQFDKLMAIVGLRVERTDVTYKANTTFRYDKAVLDYSENTNKDPHYNGGQVPGKDYAYNAYEANPADSALNYAILLPNVQFKYDLNKNTVLRLAWTTGYSRPNFKDLVPSVNVNQELEKVEMGNPGLKAAYAHNFDFLFEHYLSRVGLISGGVFYKAIDKFIYKSEGTISDPSNPYWNPTSDEQYTMVQYKNGKSAKVYGAEITLNSALTFLPWYFKNLMFTSNYTYTHSKAKTESRGDMRFPGQADHTANFSLAYSTKKLTLQASLNYNGKFMYAMGSNEDEDLWVDKRWQLDLNGSYSIIKGLTVYAEAVNVLNARAFTYMGNRNRVYDLEYTGAFLRAGVSYKF